jgi:hypothetical protein
LNVKNSARRVSTFAAVTFTWENYSDQMINLPKHEVSFRK